MTVGVEFVVGAVSGSVTAKAAPPMSSTVSDAMAIAIFFFMPKAIAGRASLCYGCEEN